MRTRGLPSATRQRSSHRLRDSCERRCRQEWRARSGRFDERRRGRVELTLPISIDEVSARRSDHMAWPLEEYFRGTAFDIQASDSVVVARIPADGIEDMVSGADKA